MNQNFRKRFPGIWTNSVSFRCFRQFYFFVLLSLFLFGVLELRGSFAFSFEVEAPESNLSEDGLFPFSADGGALDQRWTPPRGFAPAGASGQIQAKGDIFVDGAGNPIRLWGTNITFKANFPWKKDAARLAKRLRNFGFNCVRLHFVDTEIWGKYKHEFGHRRMDEEELDRLDWFIFQLKQCGIYVNLNLHVGRTLDQRDGNFPETDRLPKMQKGVDNFMPEMLEIQKEYARDLLGHVNPYSKLSYLEDPCVACIELNNENSAVCIWNCGEFDDLPQFYAAELRKRWNDWLKKRYSSTAELQKAWGCVEEPLQAEMIPDGAFTSAETFEKSPWKLEKDSKTIASVQLDQEKQCLRVSVLQPSQVNWNPQFYLTNAQIHENRPYTIQFRIRSTVEKDVHFYFMENHPSWRNERKTFKMKKDWETHRFTFLPQFTDSNVRLGFAALAGEVEIDDFSVRPGGQIGIGKGESLEEGTIQLVKFRTEPAGTSLQRQDFQEFLLDLDLEYWREMFHYVKHVLKAKAPVAGTQLRYASTYAQAEMDFCDIHTYWCHPRWPNRAWDYSDWIVENRNYVSKIAQKEGFWGLAKFRVLGKPFTLSEFHQPLPNFYGAEAFPMTACVGAFQNWSGIYSYAWAHIREHETTNSFFDICGNAVVLVHQPACVNLFVRGDLKSAETLPKPPFSILEFTREEEIQMHRKRLGGYHRSFADLSQKFVSPLEAYCGMRLPDLKIPHSLTQNVQAENRAEGWKPNLELNSPEKAPKFAKAPTEEFFWNGEVPEKAWFQIDTPKTKVFTGFTAGRTFHFKDGLELTPGENQLGWATISLTQTGENRWLLAATGAMKNTDAEYREYDFPEQGNVTELRKLAEKNLFSPQGGRLPRRCEPIPFRLLFPTAPGMKISISPLDGDAQKMETISEGTQTSACAVERKSDSSVEIRVSTETKTLWYEIEGTFQELP